MHDLRKVLRTMVARGVNRMSVRVHQDLVQLFAWAEKRQPWRGLLIEGNPADLIEIRKIVSKDFDMVNERDRVLTAKELQELQAIFLHMEADYEEIRERSVQLGFGEAKAEVKVDLRDQCTNSYGQMICQACKVRLASPAGRWWP